MTASTYNFQKIKSHKRLTVYEFSDSKNNHVVTFHKINNYFGETSGTTHDITWGIQDDNNMIFDGKSVNPSSTIQYINTIFSIIDDYFISGDTSNYLRADFYPHNSRSSSKKNIGINRFKKKYGEQNIKEKNKVLFIKIN